MAKTILFWESEGGNNYDTWSENIYVTLRKDGSWTVRAVQQILGGSAASVARYERIRSAERFVEALHGAWEELGYGAEGYEVDSGIQAVEAIDPSFASSLRVLLGAGNASAAPNAKSHGRS